MREIFFAATTESSGINFSTILLNGALVLIGMGVMGYFLMSFMKNAAKKKVEAYRDISVPIYTNSLGAVTVFPGWYPLADGEEDRYHNGEEWTEHFRPHTSESKLGDPPPEGVEVVQPKTMGEDWVAAPTAKEASVVSEEEITDEVAAAELTNDDSSAKPLAADDRLFPDLPAGAKEVDEDDLPPPSEPTS